MFLKKFLSFGIFTFISRILGFIRDLLLSYSFGAGSLADAFFIAFRIPNIFRAIFAEGSFSVTFVPIYSGIKNTESKKQAMQFSNNIFTSLFLVLILLCIFFEITMPFFLKILVPFFKGDYDLLVSLSRIMFPYIFFVSIGSVFGGLLQSEKCFFAMAIAPIILNLSMIVFGINIFHDYLCISFDICNHVYGLALSVIVAGVLQLFWFYIIAKLYGLKVSFCRPVFNGKMKSFFRRILPSLFSSTIYHMNIVVDTLFASSIVGAVSYFYYADRLLQLPLALIGIALANIILPYLSEAISQKNYQRASEIVNKAIVIACMFCFPAAIAMYFLGETIINCLFVFDYGEFNTIDARNTATLLKIFVFALPSFVLNKIFQSAFFAAEDTKNPAKFSFISFTLNLILNGILMYFLSYKGIAIASIIANWVNLFLLVFALKRKNIYSISDTTSAFLNKIFFANCIIAIILPFINYFIMIVQYSLFSIRMTFLSFAILVVMLVYFVSLYLIDRTIFVVFR
ncbi:murein biosynthesis integral membrane protein MurJ [Anaplasmataceae bacterium AB001_6]|nr:murein biosynthesis integral membrane protein MurJ [Anaplasmataceae bacterium AB001_6]